MRKLLIAAVVLALAWCSYWLIGAYAARRGVEAWVAQQRAAGLTAEYSELSLWGFPSRFDLTFTAPRLVDPRRGTGWQAPFFQVFALSYKPQHLIAVWPHRQQAITPGGPVEITSEDMRASAVFETGPGFALDHSTLIAKALKVGDGEAGWATQELRFATRRTPAAEPTHEIGVEAVAVTLPAWLRRIVDPGAGLPATFDRLHVDADLGFDRRIDRHALEVPPKLMTLALKDFTADWGELGLKADGDLTADVEGYAEGEVRVSARNWRRMMEVAVDSGALSETDAGLVGNALGLLAGQGDDTETLETTLTFKGGLVSLGPIPVGQAPRMYRP